MTQGMRSAVGYAHAAENIAYDASNGIYADRFVMRREDRQGRRGVASGARGPRSRRPEGDVVAGTLHAVSILGTNSRTRALFNLWVPLRDQTVQGAQVQP